MGVPMIRRLLAAGVEVHIWARSPEQAKNLAREGAVLVDNPAELCRRVDLVMTCVSDTETMRSIVFSTNGLAEGGAPGKTLVDMSTISPSQTADMARRLHAETGMDWVDALVSGGQSGAQAGTLAIMAGGPAEAIDKALPLLKHLSRSVTRVGDSGAGQSVKMLNQSLVSVKLMMIAEVLGLAERIGVDTSVVPKALYGGFGDSPLLQQLWPKMAAGDFNVTGTLNTLMKDLNVVHVLADEFGAQIPMTALAAKMIQEQIDQGSGSEDISSVFRLYALEKSIPDSDRDQKDAK
jgi:3-hydroxyisobutyrate dehydrogenase